jgi:oligogalacturonide lyase
MTNPLLWLTLVMMLTSSLAWAQVGRVLPLERKVVRDDRTGLDLVVLTDGNASDSKLYQTHPQWTSDGQWIVFRSTGRREAQGKASAAQEQAPAVQAQASAVQEQAFAVHEADGTIVQLTAGAGNKVGTIHLSRREMKMFYLRHVPLAAGVVPPTTRPDDAEQTQVVELDVGALLRDARAGTVSGNYESIRATLPVGLHESGGFGLDADESAAYLGVRGAGVGEHLPPGVTPYEKPVGARMGAGPGGLRRIDLRTGRVSVILDTPFQVGHVQANPWVPGELMYCWETGGKAPQRMWLVNADGSGNRALFPEQPTDWVTHEVFVGRDEILFNLIGHKPELRTRPTGIAALNLRTGALSLLGQVDEAAGPETEFPGPGGFWHCNGSTDGRFAVGDTFLGDIWLIDRGTGTRKLLSTAHRMRPDHAHPSFSPDNTRVLIQSGKWTDGKRLQLVVIPVRGK